MDDSKNSNDDLSSSPPQLDDYEQKDERFWSKMAEKYSQQPIKEEETYQKKLTITREYFTKESNVFEFGCGTGSTALLHAPFVKHIHATDISSGMIDIAKTKAGDQEITNVTFEQTSLDKVPIPTSDDERYDVVLGLNILHLLPNRDEAIAKVHQLLRPGGIFVSSTVLIKEYAGNPIAASLFKGLMSVAGFFGVVPTSVQFFTGEELKQSMVDAGFEIERELRGESTEKGLTPHCAFLVAKKKNK
jgi:ubiquinone/menaquinone biosynthesis C-methylase UbiE